MFPHFQNTQLIPNTDITVASRYHLLIYFCLTYIISFNPQNHSITNFSLYGRQSINNQILFKYYDNY